MDRGSQMNKLEKINEITKIIEEINELGKEFNNIKNPSIENIIKYAVGTQIKAMQASIISQQNDTIYTNGETIRIQYKEHK